MSRKRFTHFVWKVFARKSVPTGKLQLFRPLGGVGPYDCNILHREGGSTKTTKSDYVLYGWPLKLKALRKYLNALEFRCLGRFFSYATQYLLSIITSITFLVKYSTKLTINVDHYQLALVLVNSVCWPIWGKVVHSLDKIFHNIVTTDVSHFEANCCRA